MRKAALHTMKSDQLDAPVIDNALLDLLDDRLNDVFKYFDQSSVLSNSVEVNPTPSVFLVDGRELSSQEQLGHKTKQKLLKYVIRIVSFWLSIGCGLPTPA